jgi:NAD(P)-dependent dehydrogenase (short-subunit alcohol dehydrogenase family)
MKRHVFVSGGTSGICYGIAQAFAAAGEAVTIQGRNPEKAAQAAAAIGALPLTADVRDYAALEGALREAFERNGPIDVLVAGAAGNFPAPALGMSANGFKAVVDIDLLGTFNLCRAAHQFLRKPGAAILAISANHAHVPYLAQAHVCAAKAGVEMLCKTLALEWAPDGIRVNVIEPGPIDGTEGMARLAPTPEAREQAASRVPLHRFGRIEEVADAALFLCSSRAAYITGAVLNVDGGTALAGAGDLISASLHTPRS